MIDGVVSCKCLEVGMETGQQEFRSKAFVLVVTSLQFPKGFEVEDYHFTIFRPSSWVEVDHSMSENR